MYIRYVASFWEKLGGGGQHPPLKVKEKRDLKKYRLIFIISLSVSSSRYMYIQKYINIMYV